MEDVWLGSVLHRFPPRGCEQPVTYVTLLAKRTGLYVDEWDLRLRRQAMLVHVFNKAPERLLALHELIQRPAMHCSFPLELHCTATSLGSRGSSHGGSQYRWCTVSAEPELPTSASAVSVRGSSPCCRASSRDANDSCTTLFGSNRWSQPHQEAARAIIDKARQLGKTGRRRAWDLALTQ